jgi:phosphatidylglycerophosphatase A
VIATGIFVGYAPFFPGTVGSLLALLIYWFVPQSESVYFPLFVLLVFILGVWSAAKVEQGTGREDNQIIVIDEIVGMWITVLLFEKKLIWLAIGFVLFRLFDIFKPPPANHSEKLPRGWGVMMDDVVAGVYAAVALRAIHFFVNRVL